MFVPRASGEEYRVALLWSESTRMETSPEDSPSGIPSGGVLVAAGSDTVASFSPATGTLFSRSLRHDFFSVSPRFYLNQPYAPGGRWVLTDRFNGERHFIDYHGMPRLFGPVLAQFGIDEIVMNHPEHVRGVSLHAGMTLTAFDLVTIPGSNDRRALAARADVFGDLHLSEIDFPRARVEERGVLQTGTIVYGLAIVPGASTSEVLILRGTDPQVLELYRMGESIEDDPFLRFPVAPENRVHTPPVIRRVNGDRFAVRLRDVILLVDRRTSAVQTIARDGEAPVAGFLPAWTLGLAYAEAGENDACIILTETLQEDSPTLEWCFPGSTVAALEADLLVLERQDRFFAIGVER
ncbi:MAG: hypothetical protein EA427_10315 [Spirochaetaceae bacterium]|nr:MAG: hypothetical protein EA427_10315 [Spirochaetaceae bacterium]